MNNMKKSFFAFETAVFTVISAVFTMSANAESSTVIPVGTAYLEYSGVNETQTLDGDAIYTDGQYDMVWNVADSEINESTNIKFCVKNQDPNPLGIRDEVELKIDEIWVDGEKLDITLNGTPSYGIMTDSIYTSNEIVHFSFPLRNLSFNDLETDIDNEIRILFTINGLIDPDTYRDEHPAKPPMPSPPSMGETDSTTTTTTATTTVLKTTDTVVTAAITTTKKSGINPPKTGDSGVLALIVIASFSSVIAYILKRRCKCEKS